ncbi:MAG: PepSY-like domain-containing protein [Nonlabens sp.]
MNIKWLLAICFNFLVITMVSCQDDEDVPKAVLEAFHEMYPDEDDPDFEKDSHGYWEAHFKIDGEKYRADFHADGSWRETENSIKEKNLPTVTLKAIKKIYGNEEITEVEHVLSAKNGEFYDVEFKRKGKNKDVRFRLDGTTF